MDKLDLCTRRGVVSEGKNVSSRVNAEKTGGTSTVVWREAPLRGQICMMLIFSSRASFFFIELVYAL